MHGILARVLRKCNYSASVVTGLYRNIRGYRLLLRGRFNIYAMEDLISLYVNYMYTMFDVYISIAKLPSYVIFGIINLRNA